MALLCKINKILCADGDELPSVTGCVVRPYKHCGNRYNSIPIAVKLHIYNLASRIPALVLAVANANMGAGFLYFLYPHTTRTNFRYNATVKLLMLYLILI